MLADMTERIANGTCEFVTVNGMSPPREFSLNVWCNDQSACSFGFAMFSPPFREHGLGIHREVDHQKYPGVLLPFYQCYVGFSAAKLFFDMDARDTRELLVCHRESHIKTPSEMAVHIRKFVEDRTSWSPMYRLGDIIRAIPPPAFVRDQIHLPPISTQPSVYAPSADDLMTV